MNNSSPVDIIEKNVSEYMTRPWSSRLHLFYADPTGTMIRYHGKLKRLCKSLSWWRKWCKSESGEVVQGPLTLTEIKEAELLSVKHVQNEAYSRKIGALRMSRRIHVSSDLLTLIPAFVIGTLVVQGSFSNLVSTDVNVQPYILFKRHHLSVLLSRNEHDSSHVGSEWTLTMLRRKCWIVAACSLLQNVRCTCVTCLQFNKSPKQPNIIGKLPSECLVAEPVCFINTGIDLFSPFLVTQHRTSMIQWGVIFSCVSARVIHLEVVQSMYTDSSIMLLVKTPSREGFPFEMLSNKGTKSADAEAEMIAACCDVDTVSLVLVARDRGAKWIINPLKAAGVGGAWERRTGTIRCCLSSLSKTQNYHDDETLYTSLVEVVSLIISRPLTKASAYPEDGISTPNYLLTLQVEEGMPHGAWPLSVVTSVNTSRGGEVPNVDIKTLKHNYSRPVNKLLRLNLDSD